MYADLHYEINITEEKKEELKKGDKPKVETYEELEKKRLNKERNLKARAQLDVIRAEIFQCFTRLANFYSIQI